MHAACFLYPCMKIYRQDMNRQPYDFDLVTQCHANFLSHSWSGDSLLRHHGLGNHLKAVNRVREETDIHVCARK